MASQFPSSPYMEDILQDWRRAQNVAQAAIDAPDTESLNEVCDERED